MFRDEHLGEDTIAAIATPPGEGGIGIIRISGPKSKEILDLIFVAKNGKEIEEKKLTYGHVFDPFEKDPELKKSIEFEKDSGDKEFNDRKPIDEVMAVYMKAPYTYTREDLAEVQSHGSIISLMKIMEVILTSGARLAEPGEFTKRAYLNGRLDLSEAEALMDLIQAKTEEAHKLALSQLKGSVADKSRELLDRLKEILLKITVNIEYPDEDIEEITYEEIIKEILKMREELKLIIENFNKGRILTEGLTITITGKPNVGKSTLLNALLRQERAIVTSIPGTTRDTIEERANIKNIPVKIIDTAGIREAEDEVEKVGIERAKEAFKISDLNILMLDASEDLAEEDLRIINLTREKKTLVILNKRDLGEALNHKRIEELLPEARIIETAIGAGQGLDLIENTIEEMVKLGEAKGDKSLIITKERHRKQFKIAYESLGEALEVLERREALDFAEIDLKEAFEALGDIIGINVKEDVINEIFKRFCLGK